MCDQRNGMLIIPGGQGVLKRLFNQAFFSEPATGSGIESGDFFGAVAALQLVCQEPLKQVVVAEPFVLLIQGDDKKVGFDQPFYKGLSINIVFIFSGFNIFQGFNQL